MTKLFLASLAMGYLLAAVTPSPFTPSQKVEWKPHIEHLQLKQDHPHGYVLKAGYVDYPTAKAAIEISCTATHQRWKSCQ